MTAPWVGREHPDEICGSVGRRPGHLLHGGLDVATVDLGGLHIKTCRRDHVVPYGDDDHSSLAEHRAVSTGPVPMPLAPLLVAVHCPGEELGCEVRNVVEDARPVGEHLAAAAETPVGMRRLNALVVVSEQGRELTCVARLLGIQQPLDEQGHTTTV